MIQPSRRSIPQPTASSLIQRSRGITHPLAQSFGQRITAPSPPGQPHLGRRPRNVISPGAGETSRSPEVLPGATEIDPGSSRGGRNQHHTLLQESPSSTRFAPPGSGNTSTSIMQNPARSAPPRKTSRHIESIQPSLVAQRRAGAWKSEPPQRPATRDMVIYRRKNTNPTNCMKGMRFFGPFSVAIRSHDGKPRSLGCRKTPPRMRSGSGVFPAPSATGLSCLTRQPPAQAIYEKSAAIHAVIAH